MESTQDIENLLMLKLAEGPSLEYKRELPPAGRDARREVPRMEVEKARLLDCWSEGHLRGRLTLDGEEILSPSFQRMMTSNRKWIRRLGEELSKPRRLPWLARVAVWFVVIFAAAFAFVLFAQADIEPWPGASFWDLVVTTFKILLGDLLETVRP